MSYGYNGRILHLDLNNRSWEMEKPSEQWYRTYLGGGGIASYYLLRYLKEEVDPLSEDNVIVFATSVITGAPISGFSRYTVAAKSPLTGAFGESEAGGYFGPELKFAGYDAIVVHGRAHTPVYLWIHDGDVEIKDATALWGLDTGDTFDAIRAEVGVPQARVASIGQAGEQMILFANVISDLAHAHGRTGMGAVMGSKNLKAVAVRGTHRMEFAEPDLFKEIARWHNSAIKENARNKNLKQFGTPGDLVPLNRAGILPTRYFKGGVFDGAEKIGFPGYSKILQRSATCYACTVACKRVVAISDPYEVNSRFGGPEYETLAAFGSNCAIDELPAIAKAHELCNRYGMDTISAGNCIAFAMECFERGF